jgi:hypothetical protein
LRLVGNPDAAPTEQVIERSADGAVTIIRNTYQAAPDELITFPFGLESRAAKKLVESGKLPAAKIGRHTDARRSDVLALVDRLAKKKPTPTLSEADADYAALTRAARGGR